jgi:hypothetical protein
LTAAKSAAGEGARRRPGWQGDSGCCLLRLRTPVVACSHAWPHPAPEHDGRHQPRRRPAIRNAGSGPDPTPRLLLLLGES